MIKYIQIINNPVGAFLFSLFLFSSVYAQDPHWIQNQIPDKLYTVISVDGNTMAFEEALKLISRESGLSLNFNRNTIPVEVMVSLGSNNIPAIDALMKIVNDTRTGLILTSQGQLAVVPADSKTGTISGVVKNVKTGKPIDGVKVFVSGINASAVTGPDGFFRIPGLSPGIYSVNTNQSEYQDHRLTHLHLKAGENLEVFIEISEIMTVMMRCITFGKSLSVLWKPE